MLTDQRIAEMTVQVNAIEREIRRYHEIAPEGPDKDAAFVVLRQSVALRKPLEKYNSLRACARAGSQS